MDPVINKQNDRVVSFGQDISGVRYVSTTKHPAYAMMLGVVTLTERRCLQCGLREVTGWQVAITEKSWQRKFFLGSGKSSKTATTGTCFSRTVHQHTRWKWLKIGWVPTWLSGPKTFGPHSRLILIRWTTTCGRTLRAQPVKIATTTLKNWKRV